MSEDEKKEKKKKVRREKDQSAQMDVKIKKIICKENN